MSGLAYGASQQIRRRGEPLTLRQITPGTYDPTTRSYTGESTTDTSFTGLVAEYDQRAIDGKHIQRGDLQVWAAVDALSVTPDEGDLLLRGGGVFRLEKISQPSGPDLVWVLQVRGTQ